MKLKIKMKKHGEITSNQIVGLVLLLAGFGIVILFIVSYPWQSGIDKQACHEQIVMRSAVNFKYLDISKKVIPLDKCGTEKICLSMSGDDCEDFGPSTKEDRITKISAKNENDVMIAFANALYDCNSLLGAGKLDFVSGSLTTDEKYCLPCARIAFDKEAREKLKDISYYDLYKLMYSMKDTEGNRFLETVYPGFSSYGYTTDIFNELKKNKMVDSKLEFKDWVINIKQPGGFVIIGAMSYENALLQVLAGAGAAVGALAILTGIGAPVGVGILAVSGAAGGAVFYYTSPNKDKPGYRYVAPFVVPYNLKSLTDIQCTNFKWS